MGIHGLKTGVMSRGMEVKDLDVLDTNDTRHQKEGHKSK